MFADARQLTEGITIRTDICVVGAGAAGITLAREFIGQPLEICLLESGNFEDDPAIQTLSQAENAGLPYYPLDANRRRMFGGTTLLWTGWCRPLDRLDLETRPWVPESGWPLTRAELLPYYRRAHEVCQLGAFQYELDYWEKALGLARFPLSPEEVVTRIYHLSPPTRFGEVYRAPLAQAGNVRALLNANVVEVETNPTANAVSGLRMAFPGGKSFRVQARWYVLAAGGIENARLLLASTSAQPAGLGNQHGQVGRYFMEHLHFPSGVVLLADPQKFSADLYYRNWRPVVARLFLSESVQEQEQVLNYNVMLEPLFAETKGSGDPGSALEVARRLVAVRLHHTVEQAPNPASRITLSGQRDALGMPRVRMEWHTSDLDRHTAIRSMSRIGQEVWRTGLGRLIVKPGDNDTAWPPQPLQGKRGHHMGTTRMSQDPRRGVVDAHCRVHELANLFVAGSSVFPTSGAGTPTITIVALALRLADHLKALARTPDLAGKP